jgi:hypothetical protein
MGQGRKGRLEVAPGALHPRMLGTGLRHRKSAANVPPLPAMEGSKTVLADSRGVDARHYAIGVAAEAAQLLWGQDVDDE